MDFNIWIANLRSLVQEQENPLQIRNGHWEVVDRKALWKSVGGRVFDTHLEKLRVSFKEVLSEIDPQFELDSEDRPSAIMFGKTLRYSTDLRRGMSETLALLGADGAALTNCSQHKPENTAVNVVHELLEQADWRLWGSLNDLLPNIAEAAPNEFLNCVESSLQCPQAPFVKLFSEGSEGFSGRNYMTGLLWALEALGWSEENFMRVVVILAELASIDPGGNHGNRPVNSLKTMILPWFPQTMAGAEKRIVSVKAVKAEFPDIAWNVLKSLLPNQHQTSTGTYKPRWLEVVPDDWEPKVSNQEYRDQVAAYAEIAVEMSYGNLERIKELVKNLDNLPQPSFDRFLAHLSSDAVRGLSEPERLTIWSTLTEFVAKHRRFSDAEWSLDEEVVSKIDEVAGYLAPISKDVLYRRLFSTRDFDLYEEKGDWEGQRKKLEGRRKQAVKEILDEHGVEGVVRFLDSIEAPNLVGWALGVVAGAEVDAELLPAFLATENDNYKKFIGAYIWSKNFLGKQVWIEGLDRKAWTTEQSCQFLMYLPFESTTWILVDQWLGAEKDKYWQAVPVNPYPTESDLLVAVDNLLRVSRPQQAVECLSARLHKKLPFDSKRTAAALIGAVKEDSSSGMDSYNVAELIKALQSDPATDPDDLFRVEWAYLPMLGAYSEAKPKLLQEKLATQPSFFCELIRLIYRSTKDQDNDVEEPTEQAKAIATNAWRLLHEWEWPPGLQVDNSFSTAEFDSWFSSVKAQCVESGHLEVALVKLGEVLFYCPADSNGLWIVESVAKVLNSRDGESIRSGFCTEVFNSRGAHFVDPTGSPERELANHWREKANAVENAGYPRFAASLRELAGSYDRHAERIIKRQEERS
ncbi:hypothetical protein [Pseudomonas rubra]|uniref:Ferritin-like diiron domain-containing protein n=1 Tax=Pseudomonas rubra TaxID=2942627 RepID=A0ABT5PB46_9PSED|nr:hypothetical protein [Pseudomonas rubra]MDD1015526.1 hypothetical protein [Pseudomonas rubra]MDD1041632.1 hypothetical protein [Pseudomonas rubra]MDD1157124.1 hypothetical protein [Pseudomonas rubra]